MPTRTPSSTLDEATTTGDNISTSLTEDHWPKDPCSRDRSSKACYCYRFPFLPDCGQQVGTGLYNPRPRPRPRPNTSQDEDDVQTPRDIINPFIDLIDGTDTGNGDDATGTDTNTGNGNANPDGGRPRIVRRARISKDMQPVVLGLGVLVLIVIAYKSI